MKYIIFFGKILLIYWPTTFAVLAIIIISILIKWPFIQSRYIRITDLTYLGAFIYISFYLLLFMVLRWVQVNQEIDLKKLPKAFGEFSILYNKSFFNIIFFTLLIILCLLLWWYIFIKIRKILSYQVWKIYFYYRYKYLLAWQETHINPWQDKCVEFFTDYLSYYKFCFKINLFLTFICEKLNLKTLVRIFDSLKIFYIGIRVILMLLIIVIFLYECYYNNYVISSLKYYLLFYMFFILWYKISTFFRHEFSLYDKIIFEMHYCDPQIVYVNLTQDEVDLLRGYIENPSDTDINYMFTFILAKPPITYYKRFVYTESKNLMRFSDERQEFIYIKEDNPCIYLNKYTQRCFPKEWLVFDQGFYYVRDGETPVSVDDFIV